MVTILEMFQLTPQELIFKLFLPFILTLVILFAVLQMVRLFNRRINLIISLVATIMIATTPLFSAMAAWISQFGAYTALIAFIAVFVIGVGAWAFRRGSEYISGTIEEMHRLDKEIRKLQNKLNTEGNPRKRMQIAREISDLRRVRDELRHHM